MKKKLNNALNIALEGIKPAKKIDLDIDLIKGSFTPVDAADILLSLVNDKIKFHTIRQLNLNDDQIENNPKSDNRIVELRNAKKEITSLILKARTENYSLEIESRIQIRLNKNVS